MADWVFAVERAYVAAASRPRPELIDRASASAPMRDTLRPRAPLRDPAPTGGDPTQLARAKAAAAAVASRFLAVGTPRSVSFVFDTGPELEEAVLTLEAHRTWFAPLDLRCARSIPGAEELAERIGGRAVTIAEALAADIVNVHGAYVPITAPQLRRGTHVNVLGYAACVDAELRVLATCVDEARGLPALAAGLVDGRQLDELTVFFAGDAAIALAALGQRP